MQVEVGVGAGVGKTTGGERKDRGTVLIYDVCVGTAAGRGSGQ